MVVSVVLHVPERELLRIVLLLVHMVSTLQVLGGVVLLLQLHP